MKLFIMQFFQAPTAPPLLGSNILLSTVFKHPQTMFLSCVRDQVSHPNKSGGENIVLCILILKLLERKREHKRL